ncbi:MAG: hypothetical protein ACE15D_10030 [Candidatus Eisenbacteria bacterium]|nr:hypothetical protein [Candidatus Eisenbacteria bacterium]
MTRVEQWRWIVGAALTTLLAVPLFAGCSGENRTAGGTGSAAADSAVYAQAAGLEDESARMAALEQFLKEHPHSEQAAEAYARLVPLELEHRPESVQSTLQQFLKTDFPSAAPYNSVGWDLAEREQHLDLAVPILEKGVAKARAEGDSNGIASVLDSYAWALYKKGDAAAAAEPILEARKIYGQPIDEIEEHAALILDAAGRDDEAREIYVALLGHQESPKLRQNLEKIVAEKGESMADVDASIQATRAANAFEAPDFTLPTLADGTPLSLSSLRGKVVLLNFWHPT